MTEKKREEFKKEGLRPAQVPDVTDGVEDADVVLFVHVLVLVLHLSKASSFMSSVSRLALRLPSGITWMQRWIQPTASLRSQE